MCGIVIFGLLILQAKSSEVQPYQGPAETHLDGYPLYPGKLPLYSIMPYLFVPTQTINEKSLGHFLGFEFFKFGVIWLQIVTGMYFFFEKGFELFTASFSCK